MSLFAAYQTQNTETQVTRQEVIEGLSQLLTNPASDAVLPDTLSKSQGVKILQIVANAVSGRGGSGVSLASEPSNVEALRVLPGRKGLSAMSEDTLKDHIEEIYQGGKPRGKFTAEKWSEKLYNDKLAVIVRENPGLTAKQAVAMAEGKSEVREVTSR